MPDLENEELHSGSADEMPAVLEQAGILDPLKESPESEASDSSPESRGSMAHVNPFETVEAPESAPPSTSGTVAVPVSGTLVPFVTGLSTTFPGTSTPAAQEADSESQDIDPDDLEADSESQDIDPDDLEYGLRVLTLLFGFPAGELKTRLAALESQVVALEEKLKHHGICGPQS